MTTYLHLRNYYAQLWGPPSRTADFVASDIKIEVSKWAADIHPEDVAFYITNGLSSHELKKWDPSHRLELFIGFTPEEDRVVEALASLAASPILDGVRIKDKDTVTFPDPLWEGTGMRSLMVSRPKEEIVRPLWLEGGIHIEFMQLIPLYPSEMKIKEKRGAEELLDLWRENGVAFWDPNRSALCGGYS